MKFHKEGYPTLFISLAFSAILIFIAHYFFGDFKVAMWFAYALSAFLLITVLQFFRSPIRTHNIDSTKVIAPADGKVVVIEETEEGEYFKDKRLQISIFMSPVNVHSNRYPISGIVKFVKYHPGKFLAAWEPKSSTENDIVLYAKEGDNAQQGAEFGFIKFGSRVDIFLPLGTMVNVKIGDKVKGTQSVIAEI
jgi:phosphatidylserine decarboxylase